MGTFFNILCVSILLFFTSPLVMAQQMSFRPKSLLLPVSKDPTTLQYITQIHQRTPLVPVKLTVDLNGENMWVNCHEGYVSSSYIPVRCNSHLCHQSRTLGCIKVCESKPTIGCHNNSCAADALNPIRGINVGLGLYQDVVAIQSTNGVNPGRVVTIPKMPFACGHTYALQGLANGVQGIAGLGRTKVSLPYLFSSAFSLQKKFTLCLSGSKNGSGVIFFGNGSYIMQPNVDVSLNLHYTPLILVFPRWSRFVRDPLFDYYVGVESIRVNEKPLKLNTTLLSINRAGRGGSRFSTVHPYTVLETSIYNALVDAFVSEMPRIPRVKAVAPFGVCFDAKSIRTAIIGPDVPNIDLAFPNSIYWRIFGSNSMVQVSEDVLCLGFVDGGAPGPNERASIVIGGYQMEDNIFEFDLARSRVGFSFSVLFRDTTCANFNFTSTSH